VFAATMADIDKALRVKVYTDPKKKLPCHWYEYLKVFDRKAANKLPSLRGKEIDHAIELERKGDGTEPEVP